MADITKCATKECPQEKYCWRKTAPENAYFQSFAEFKGGQDCVDFFPDQTQMEPEVLAKIQLPEATIKAVTMLPTMHRDAIILRYGFGFSFFDQQLKQCSDVAERLGIARSKAYTLIQEALRKIRAPNELMSKCRCKRRYGYIR